jgi:hypothetical protein
MIHSVMIVSEGGLCLYNYSFTKMEIDPQLVAGFTNAIDSFSASLIKKHQNIESLEMSSLNLRISSFLRKTLSVIIFYNKYDSVEVLDQIIIELKSQFIERFGQYSLEDFYDLNILKPFDSVVVALCKTHFDVGLLSSQAPYKAELWSLIEQINGDQHKIDSPPSSPLPSKENKFMLNTIAYLDTDLPNCDISLWNLDLEAVESSQHIFQNKHIFLLIIEPDFKFIKRNLAMIELLKENFTDSHIVGILLTDYGTITKKNCEMLLQISLSNFQINDPDARDNMKQIIREAILGV